jgi:NAD(P)-dependent dehydrogenase (short-subunit alcohol dehydrogenase family)
MQKQGLGRFAGAAGIVIGGAHGIGRACAIRLAEEGAQMAVADLDQTAGEQVAASLPDTDGRHLAVWLDVTDGSSVKQAFAAAASELGRIDVVINVAGGDTHHGTFEETTDEVWVQMIELNLFSVVRCCRVAIPHLRRSAKTPAIVNVSSINALAALGSEPYSSAKAGIGALTINLAASLAADGIRVNTVAPATIRTRTGMDKRVEPIASATSIRSDASVNLRTSPLQSPFLPPAMPPGSLDTRSRSTAGS